MLDFINFQRTQKGDTMCICIVTVHGTAFYRMCLLFLKEGRTALSIACWKGNLDMASELLSAGANTDIQDQVEKLSPMHA